jgi:uncharacterized protein (TIGR03067 family)
MTPLATLLYAAALAAGPKAPAPRLYQDDAMAIQGKWLVVGLWQFGREEPTPVKFVFQFKGDQLTIADATPYRFRLASTTHPRGMDLLRPDGKGVTRRHLAIYSLAGDELRISLNNERGARPKDFRTDKKSDSVWVLRRVRDRK